MAIASQSNGFIWSFSPKIQSGALGPQLLKHISKNALWSEGVFKPSHTFAVNRLYNSLHVAIIGDNEARIMLKSGHINLNATFDGPEPKNVYNQLVVIDIYYDPTARQWQVKDPAKDFRIGFTAKYKYYKYGSNYGQDFYLSNEYQPEYSDAGWWLDPGLQTPSVSVVNKSLGINRLYYWQPPEIENDEDNELLTTTRLSNIIAYRDLNLNGAFITEDISEKINSVLPAPDNFGYGWGLGLSAIATGDKELHLLMKGGLSDSGGWTSYFHIFGQDLQSGDIRLEGTFDIANFFKDKPWVGSNSFQNYSDEVGFSGGSVFLVSITANEGVETHTNDSILLITYQTEDGRQDSFLIDAPDQIVPGTLKSKDEGERFRLFNIDDQVFLVSTAWNKNLWSFKSFLVNVTTSGSELIPLLSKTIGYSNKIKQALAQMNDLSKQVDRGLIATSASLKNSTYSSFALYSSELNDRDRKVHDSIWSSNFETKTISEMLAGIGNNNYDIASTGIIINEPYGNGIDTVSSSGNAQLGVNIENLRLYGSTAVNGSGNSLNNTITGNSSANHIDGSTGADKMIGGKGDDEYVIDNSRDQIIEKAREGIDSVFSSISYILGSNLENLYLTGEDAVDGYGNSLSNALIGNSNANNLRGGGGADTLTGLGGADVFTYTSFKDSLLGSFDRITDFEIGIDTIDYTYAVNSSAVRKLGSTDALRGKEISQLLSKNVFLPRTGAVFTFMDTTNLRTFLALNDSNAGFQASKDAIIEITGYRGDLGSLQIL